MRGDTSGYQVDHFEDWAMDRFGLRVEKKGDKYAVYAQDNDNELHPLGVFEDLGDAYRKIHGDAIAERQSGTIYIEFYHI